MRRLMIVADNVVKILLSWWFKHVDHDVLTVYNHHLNMIKHWSSFFDIFWWFETITTCFWTQDFITHFPQPTLQVTPGMACASTAVPMRGPAPEASGGSDQNLGCVGLYMEDTFSGWWWLEHGWMIFYFSIWECRNPNWWVVHHFSEGFLSTTNQDICIYPLTTINHH